MTEARMGRLLAACLHEAIAERLPERVEFYEHWLTSTGLRDGTIGAAPMLAVIGFLRTEPRLHYDAVMWRAGELAALWSVASLAPVRRRAILWLPRVWRARAALLIAAGILRGVASSRVSTRVRGGRARIEIAGSPFCAVREAQPLPLCGFHVAVAVETLRQFGLDAAGRVERCRAVEAGPCLVGLEMAAPVAAPAVAA